MPSYAHPINTNRTARVSGAKRRACPEAGLGSCPTRRLADGQLSVLTFGMREESVYNRCVFGLACKQVSSRAVVRHADRRCTARIHRIQGPSRSGCAGGNIVKVHESGTATAVRQEVAARVGETRYQLWFADSARFELHENELIVGVPNLFFQEWLATNFLGLLKEAAQTVLGYPVSVRIVVDPELFQRVRENGSTVSRSRQRTAEPTAGPLRDDEPREEGEEARDRFTFDRFVVGACNEFAYSAAVEVTRRPGVALNPLVLYGPLGTGKTHLLRAIAHAVTRHRRSCRAVYLTSETFTNRFLEAMQARQLAKFRREIRGARFLLLDDLQFLTRTVATQRELLHTVDELVAARAQVVVASDQHPSYLSSLSAALRERLVTGMTCELRLPDRETRERILRAKAAELKLSLSEPILQFVVDNVAGSVRELEGALNRLLAVASLSRCKLTLDVARQAIADLIRRRLQRVTMKDIERSVCQLFNLDAKTLRSRSRASGVAYPRLIAMYLARKHTGASYKDIGKYFGGRLHTTAISAEKRVRDLIEKHQTVQIGGVRWSIEDVVAAIERTLGV